MVNFSPITSERGGQVLDYQKHSAGVRLGQCYLPMVFVVACCGLAQVCRLAAQARLLVQPQVES